MIHQGGKVFALNELLLLVLVALSTGSWLFLVVNGAATVAHWQDADMRFFHRAGVGISAVTEVTGYACLFMR